MVDPVASPFVRPVVRQIIEGLFREQPQWKSGDLVDRSIASSARRVRRTQPQLHHKTGIAGSQGRWFGYYARTRLVALDRLFIGRPSHPGRTGDRHDSVSR